MLHQQDQRRRSCNSEQESLDLRKEGKRLLAESKHLMEEAGRLKELGEELIQKADEWDHSHCVEKDLFIIVNRMRFDESKGVKHEMTDDLIARLVGLTGSDTVVRRLLGEHDTSDPLKGVIHIKRGDQFIVTRQKVEGGRKDRLDNELSILREGLQKVEIIGSHVLYHDVPAGLEGRERVDVIVPIPNGYPSSMIDRAGLPEGSPLIKKVKGAPQEVIHVGGKSWRLISYHPHKGGGGETWNANRHGFHTYLGEIIAWLGVLK